MQPHDLDDPLFNLLMYVSTSFPHAVHLQSALSLFNFLVTSKYPNVCPSILKSILILLVVFSVVFFVIFLCPHDFDLPFLSEPSNTSAILPHEHWQSTYLFCLFSRTVHSKNLSKGLTVLFFRSHPQDLVLPLITAFLYNSFIGASSQSHWQITFPPSSSFKIVQ